MELKGNTAERWEQISTALGDIAAETDKQHQMLEKVSELLSALSDSIKANQDALVKLSGAAYKEVLRESSKMLNDDPEVYVSQPIDDSDDSDAKSDDPSKGSLTPSTKKQSPKKAETVPKASTDKKKSALNQQQLLPSEEQSNG